MFVFLLIHKLLPHETIFSFSALIKRPVFLPPSEIVRLNRQLFLLAEALQSVRPPWPVPSLFSLLPVPEDSQPNSKMSFSAHHCNFSAAIPEYVFSLPAPPGTLWRRFPTVSLNPFSGSDA